MSAQHVLVLLAAAVIVVGWRVIKILYFPLTSCLRCKGDGKRRDRIRKHWRLCKRCASPLDGPVLPRSSNMPSRMFPNYTRPPRMRSSGSGSKAP
jgi:predicted amidophosphoribosyltransferase